MIIGVNTWVWTAPLTTASLEKIAPRIAEMGFKHIEIPFEDPSLLDIPACKVILDKAGFKSVSAAAVIGSDRDLIDPDPAVRANGLAYVKKSIDDAAILGARNLVGPFYSSVGRTWQQSPSEREADIRLLVSVLTELADYAEKKGIFLGLEPLNRFETSFINTAQQAVEVIDRVGNPHLGIMLDTFHMNIEEDSMGDAVRLVGPRLVQVHSNENNRGTPGLGHIPWSEVAHALKEIHFDGVMVIESFTSEVKEIARAAAIWRPLAKSQDDLAKGGLAFLSELMR